MPVRSLDPFKTNDRLHPSVNPFVGHFSAGLNGDLPILGGESLRAMAGNWRQRLKASGKLHLEIGCHKGNILVNMARQNTSDGFIGIDITYKRVVMTAQRLRRAERTNGAAVLANARALEQLFAPGELDTVVIFFPDPWPKARHEKNRLLSLEFCQLLHPLLKDDGCIWFKTDSYSYFVSAEQALHGAGFQRLADSDRQGLTAQVHMSTFESHFTSRFQPVVDQVFIKAHL